VVGHTNLNAALAGIEARRPVSWEVESMDEQNAGVC
jgi:hypothetical protein